jgi:hypothetical protein
MDRIDLSYIEAYLRNLLIQLGREWGLPLQGRDWELGVAAVLALIALMTWTWPVRRAFSRGNPIRWIVVALTLASLSGFWPVWVFALLLSGIRRGATPPPQAQPAPRTASAPANQLPRILAGALRTLMQSAQQRSGGSGKVGPWGKHARPAQPAASAPAAAARPVQAARPAAASRPAVSSAAATVARPRPAVSSSGARSSKLPNRETWIRRR